MVFTVKIIKQVGNIIGFHCFPPLKWSFFKDELDEKLAAPLRLHSRRPLRQRRTRCRCRPPVSSVFLPWMHRSPCNPQKDRRVIYPQFQGFTFLSLGGLLDICCFVLFFLVKNVATWYVDMTSHYFACFSRTWLRQYIYIYINLLQMYMTIACIRMLNNLGFNAKEGM